MKTICFLLTVATILTSIFKGSGQSFETMYLNKNIFLKEQEKLKKEFGVNKSFEPSLELECLAALSFYPELKTSKISFQFGKPLSTMVSKPQLRSVFKPKKEREYVITIRMPGTSKNGLDWTELSFNALVGWIGHELAHILHYSNKTNAGVLFTGLKYAFPKYRKRMERFTDFIAIKHELGYALLEGTDYAINYSHATAHYKKYLRKYYLLPEEIKEKIDTKPDYLVSFKKTKIIKLENSSLFK